MSLRSPRKDAFNQRLEPHGVHEPRLESCYEYQEICGAEDETRGADKSEPTFWDSLSDSKCARKS
jgi:hypothetical protein